MQNSLKNKSKTSDIRKSLKGLKTIADATFLMQRGSVSFSNNDKEIHYYKLVFISKEYDKSTYYNNMENKSTYAEWVFQVGRPHNFSFKVATRFDLLQIDFIKEALIQVNNSFAVKVLEEVDFDLIRNKDSLQYLKIISADDKGKELYYEQGKLDYGYQNGERYSLTDADKAKFIAEQYNGILVKVTETLL